jgi:hypothetical protein
MSLLVLTAIVLGAAALSVAAMLAVRRYGAEDAVLTDSNHASAIYGVVGTAFAVILGFIMFFSFGGFSDAKHASGAEASAVSDMFHTSEYFPADHERVGGELICLGRAVVHQEWPAMDRNERSDVAAQWHRDVEDTIRENIRPSGASQEAAFGTLLIEQDRGSDARRARLTEADPAVSPPVMLILILGGVVSTAFVLLFADRRESALLQGAQIAAVAGLVVAGLAVIWFLDHPYEGQSGSINPTEMQRAVDNMEAERPPISPPCSESGLPLSSRR